MTAHIALRKTAMDNEGRYGKDIATILERNFCVDYMLKNFPTGEDPIKGIRQVKDLRSNNTAVLKSIPDDNRRTSVKD